MSESTYERSAFDATRTKVGQTNYNKFFDNTTGKWERLSGSGAPQFIVCGVSGSIAIPVSAIIDPLQNRLFVTNIPYTYDISEGNVSGHTPWSKIGYNPALVANTEADLWSNAGVYTFPSGASQMQVLSTSTADTGIMLFSGSSTSGSKTTLVDTGQNFSTVETGDCVILDKSMDGGRTPEWGYVTAVATTTLTVGGGFSSAGSGLSRNYYVVDKNATNRSGSQAVRIEYLDSNYAQKYEIVILSGSTAMNTVNTDLFRINSFRVIAAGSYTKATGNNVVRQVTGVVTGSFITSGYTRARNVQYTVPLGKTLYITSFSCAYGFTDTTAKPHYCRMHSKANAENLTGLNTLDIFYPYTEVVVSNNTVFIEPNCPTKLPAKTDIKVSAIADAAGIATIAINGWLE